MTLLDVPGVAASALQHWAIVANSPATRTSMLRTHPD
jgi:hypothetical protein